jgi:hypothetical protein
MRINPAVPLLTITTLALSATTLGAQAPRDRGPAPAPSTQAVPRGDRDGDRGRYDERGRNDERRRYDERDRRGAPFFRVDVAFRTGFTDGYDAGFTDARRRHRFDPFDEGRYRSANRGYDRRYGSKDVWRVRYRDGFRRGYEDAFDDVYRQLRHNDRPWWWN